MNAYDGASLMQNVKRSQRFADHRAFDKQPLLNGKQFKIETDQSRNRISAAFNPASEKIFSVFGRLFPK